MAGFYDHVTPPAAIPPDTNNLGFGFDSLGVRVPAILVSPYVAAGCDDTVYDHTSILRYVLEKYGLPPLGARTTPSSDPRAVGNFGAKIMAVARSDGDTLPPFSSAAKKFAEALEAGSPTTAAKVPPDNSRRALLAFAERMRLQSQHLGARAAMAEAASQLAPPPTTTVGFAERVEKVDAWLRTRDNLSVVDADTLVARLAASQPTSNQVSARTGGAGVAVDVPPSVARTKARRPPAAKKSARKVAPKTRSRTGHRKTGKLG